MTNENLVYVKFDYYEALESKRNILSSEMSILNIMKAMRKYHALRLKEIDKKKLLLKKMKELELFIKKSKANLPLTKAQKEIKKEKIEIKTAKAVRSIDDDLESQLWEIQDRLKELGG